MKHILRSKANNLLEKGNIDKIVAGYLNNELVDVYYISYRKKRYIILEREIKPDKLVELEYYECDEFDLLDLDIVSDKELYDVTMSGLKSALSSVVDALKDIKQSD